MGTLIRALGRGLDTLSQWALTFGVMGILILSLLAMALRWMQISLMWIDPAVRHLVFFCAFFGGVLAVGRRSHITIDLLGRALEARGAKLLKGRIDIFMAWLAAAATAWLGVASYHFMLSELEFGKEAFLGIHSGVLVGMIPAGLAMISMRFLLLSGDLILNPQDTDNVDVAGGGQS